MYEELKSAVCTKSELLCLIRMQRKQREITSRAQV
jgi:hypothetical protein